MKLKLKIWIVVFFKCFQGISWIKCWLLSRILKTQLNWYCMLYSVGRKNFNYWQSSETERSNDKESYNLYVLSFISRSKELIASLNLWLFIYFLHNAHLFYAWMQIVTMPDVHSYYPCIWYSYTAFIHRSVQCRVIFYLYFQFAELNLDIQIYIWSKKLVTFPSTTEATSIDAGGGAYGNHGQKPQPFIL